MTGLGVVASNGIGIPQFWKGNVEGRSGVVPISFFDSTQHETKIGGEIRNFDAVALLGPTAAKHSDRFAHFALVAVGEALTDAGLRDQPEVLNRAGVYVGSGVGGMMYYEKQVEVVLTQGARRAHPTGVPKVMPNAPAGDISIAFGMRGPNLTVCTACSSGGHAVGLALDAIRMGRAQVAVAGGTEAPLTHLTYSSFGALRVMSRRNAEPERASRPFDRDRDGFVMGEGAGMLVLESEEHARKRGAKIYAEVAGYGSSGSGYHMVMPNPDGSDAHDSMRLALEDAGVPLDRVDYINAHGTATRQNDDAEAAAVHSLFGAHAPKISISATKSMIGHLVGAAGGVEAVVSCLVLEHGIVPPTINLDNPDPTFGALDFTPLKAKERKVRTAVSNSFGFGGNNTSIVFQKLA